MTPSDADAGEADTDVVAAVLQAVANPNRLRLVQGLSQGRSRAELVEDLPISGSGVTNHLRELETAGLVYRGEDGWTLSPLGEFFAAFLAEQGGRIADVVQQVDAAEQEAQVEFEDVPLSDQELQRAVTRRTWELAQEDVENMLASSEAGDSGGDS